jgi:hypothetical protein
MSVSRSRADASEFVDTNETILEPIYQPWVTKDMIDGWRNTGHE